MTDRKSVRAKAGGEIRIGRSAKAALTLPAISAEMRRQSDVRLTSAVYCFGSHAPSC